jgi:hypothetical protein
MSRQQIEIEFNRQKIREHGYHVSDNEELVLSNVDKHFNTNIQIEAVKKFKRKYSESDIHKELKKQVEEFNTLIDSEEWLKEKKNEAEEDNDDEDEK